MNVIEAIKSGKRFKRRSEKAWMSDDQLYNYVKEDIIADDWEIEIQPVTITRADFDAAWDKAHRAATFKEIYEMLCNELGL